MTEPETVTEPVSEPFTARLRRAVGQRGRLCVGIDPHPSLLDDWGLPRSPAGLAAFTDACVAAFGDAAAVVKPQVALFEEYGAAGLAVLERTIADLRGAGALVIADAKRADIGSTMEAYARAWLGDGAPLSCDAVTTVPYLGFGALQPAVDLARASGRGVFVLARTSNPEGRNVQTARLSSSDDGPGNGQAGPARSVAQSVVDDASGGHGSVGLVVGATRAHGLDLSGFGGPILAPGLGAQGAEPGDLPEIFPGSTDLLLATSSRAVLRLGPRPQALRGAALRLTHEIESALP